MRGLVEYPFPLRGGNVIAYLRLPSDLTRADVAQIARMLETLVLEESVPVPETLAPVPVDG